SGAIADFRAEPLGARPVSRTTPAIGEPPLHPAQRGIDSPRSTRHLVPADRTRQLTQPEVWVRTGKEHAMRRLTRRSLIHGSAGLLAAGSLARPFIANAQAKTAEVRWVQGFVQEEDISFKKIVADYEKASGNKIDYIITPLAP